MVIMTKEKQLSLEEKTVTKDGKNKIDKINVE